MRSIVVSGTLVCVVVFCLGGGAKPLCAHEFSPALLSWQQISSDTWRATWKCSRTVDPETLSVQWPEGCNASKVQEELFAGARVENWSLQCSAAVLHEQPTVFFASPRGRTLDILVRWEPLDRALAQRVVRAPSRVVLPRGEKPNVWVRWALMGWSHILWGADHLLLLLGLALLLPARGRLFAALAGFTTGHAAILAAAWSPELSVWIPPLTVEVMIAASLVWLAFGLAQVTRGAVRREDLALVRWPWVLSLGFGLVHGAGFTRSLLEVYTTTPLAQRSLWETLLAFHLGVEAGQLAFVAIVLLLLALGRRTIPQHMARVCRFVAYSTGAVGMYWLGLRLWAWGGLFW